MKLDEYIDYQRTEKGIRDISSDWGRIKSDSYPNTSLYLEWLVWRILISTNREKAKVIHYMTLDENYYPLKNAPGNKPDIVILYKSKILVCEVTERPIPGKIEHFQHVADSEMEYKNKAVGILITRAKLESVPSEVWNTYKCKYKTDKPLFMLADIDFLISLLNKFRNNSQEKWLNFINQSEKIWCSNNNWKITKEEIISLQNLILCDEIK